MRITSTFVLAITLMLAGAGSPAATSFQQESTARPGDDGIKVHGHWTIDLTNPDGSPAGHHEFENALTPGGAAIIAGLLQSNNPRGRWSVSLFTAQPNLNPCDGHACEISEPGHPGPPLPLLSVDLVSNGRAVKLSGSVTPTQDCSVVQVWSVQTPNPGQAFSVRELPSPIPVVAGQSIAVSVVLSFS